MDCPCSELPLCTWLLFILSNSFLRLEKQLSKLEQNHHIHTRWGESAKEYKEMEIAFSQQKKKQISTAKLFGLLPGGDNSC